MKSIAKHFPISEASIVKSIKNAQHLDHDNDKIPVYPYDPALPLWSLLHNWMADQAQGVWWLVKVKVIVNVMMVVLMAVEEKKQKLTNNQTYGLIREPVKNVLADFVR